MDDTAVDTLTAGRERSRATSGSVHTTSSAPLTPRANSGPDDLEQLAEGARWSRHYPDVLDTFERAQVGSPTPGIGGAQRGRAQAAWENFTRNDDAVATGWYGQAATLLEDDTESADTGCSSSSPGTRCSWAATSMPDATARAGPGCRPPRR